MPGILSGAILALSRALGETAPLVLIGAVTFIAFTPETVLDPFTALPVQIFHWVTRSQDEFRGLAAAAIIVLLALLLGLNTFAVFLRNRLEKRN
jgi:phosphate transport system permease protein